MVKGLVDGWGNPLVFVRWPVYLKAANYGLTGTPQPKFNDPGDPTGLLASPGWQASSGFAWFTANIHGLAPHTSGEPTTYRAFPVIASAGQNNQLGFNPLVVTFPNPQPSTPPTTGVTADADDLLATLNQ